MGKGSGRGGNEALLGPCYQCFEDVRNVVCCIVVMLVVSCIAGVICTIMGFSMWGSMATDNRSANIKRYNKDVSSWTNTYYTPFKNAAGSHGVKFNGNNTMTTDTSADSLEESDQSKLDPYSYVRYKVTGALSRTTETFNDNTQKTLKFTVNGGAEQSVTVNLYGYITENISSSCYDEVCSGTGKNRKCHDEYNSQKCLTACRNRGGNNAYLSNQTTCHKQARVHKVCVKMSETSGSFVIDSSWGGAGCFPSNYDSFAGYDKPAQYTTSSCTGDCTWLASNTVSVYVRELHDPFVQLLNWNNGSTTFGLTTVEKFVYGLLLIIVGALCCMPTILPIIILSCVLLFCGASAMAWYKSKTGKDTQDHVQLQEDVENIQPLNPPQQGGYPLQQGGYPPQQGGYPPQQGGYPPQQSGYPPQQGGYPPQQGGYPPQQGGYPPQQGGYPPQQGGYPPQQGGYPPQQGGYPPQQGGYPPQQGGYPPQQGGYPSQGAFPTQGGDLPPPTNPAYN